MVFMFARTRNMGETHRPGQTSRVNAYNTFRILSGSFAAPNRYPRGDTLELAEKLWRSILVRRTSKRPQLYSSRGVGEGTGRWKMKGWDRKRERESGRSRSNGFPAGIVRLRETSMIHDSLHWYGLNDFTQEKDHIAVSQPARWNVTKNPRSKIDSGNRNSGDQWSI